MAWQKYKHFHTLIVFIFIIIWEYINAWNISCIYLSGSNSGFTIFHDYGLSYFLMHAFIIFIFCDRLVKSFIWSYWLYCDASSIPSTPMISCFPGTMLTLLKYPFYPMFNFDNGMNLISKSLTILTSGQLQHVLSFFAGSAT